MRGYRLLRTDAPAPFDQLLMRGKGARRKSVDLGVVSLLEDEEPSSWNADTPFKWDDVAPIVRYFDTPEAVTASWRGQFQFHLEDEATGQKGLRPPQAGALHAVAAHLSVGVVHEPATVVLPTGTGKTETMLAAMVYVRPARLLVLLPSDALRDQIGKKFEQLGLLRELGCVPPTSISPRVVRLVAGVRTRAEAEEIVREANVIIALPNTLEASDKAAAATLIGACDTLYVDEAHHLGATTWEKVRDQFAGKTVVQFTATPFRNDRKHIGGRIIFNYKLSDAQRDKYYQPIRLETVEEFGDDSLRDRAIAERAVAILRQDRQRFDHLLLARVNNTAKADEILGLYRELAPDLKPVVVYSGPGRRHANQAALASLQAKGDGGSKIVVCVDMLGEGFDLPELKVAAIHDNHKSLAVTLQFVGRFTRRGENVGEAVVVINIADPNAERRLEDLYAEGADWDHLVSRLSDTQIAGELQLEAVINSLKTSGDLHEHLSLWNLTPALSTQVYRTKCEDWSPHAFRDVFSKDAVLWHSLSRERHLLVAVAQQEFGVRWGKYEDVKETTYDLLIAYWDQAHQVLFVHASDYDRMRVGQVAQAITSADTEVLGGPQVFNVLNNVQLPLAKSLGSARFGNISFTSYFGPNVTEGLASIEKRESELNYIGCLGYENGDKVLWGAAQRKGKIWQQRSGSIEEWVAWCDGTYRKLMDDTGRDANITRDFLRPQKLTTLYELPPISAQWGDYLQSSFSDGQALLFGETEVPLYQADVEVVSTSPEKIELAFFSDEHRAVYAFKIDPALPKGYQYEHLNGPAVSFRISRHTTRPFEEQMYVDPIVLRYPDGTFSYNNFHIPFDLGASDFPADRIEAWDWTGVALNQESMGQTQQPDTIQYRAFEHLQADYPLIFNDDGPGEAGDLVAIRDGADNQIELCLVHCKNAHGGVVSGDITNLYTVCGQAQKSIAVKHEGLRNLATDLRRRHERWARQGYSRILKGNLKLLSFFAEKSRKTTVKFEVIVVQPGFSRSSITPDMAKLLATTELFLKRTTEAEFRVVASE